MGPGASGALSNVPSANIPRRSPPSPSRTSGGTGRVPPATSVVIPRHVAFQTDVAENLAVFLALRDRAARFQGSVMVTPQEMRLFALECLRWSEEADDASQRDLMIRVARSWMDTASTIERRVSGGDELADDLRIKLD
jgi:hypothetical protein